MKKLYEPALLRQQLLWAVIKSELLTPHRLVFRAENVYYTVMRAKIEAGARRPKREVGCAVD